MAKYLLEVGTEELPYKFIPSAEKQLAEIAATVLQENRIEYKSLKTYGTPRRLALIVDDISETQPDLEKEIKGPPSKIALDSDKKLTQAGLGFLKKINASENDAYTQELGGVEYIFVKLQEKGRKTEEILSEIIPNMILKLQGPYFMRWGHFDTKFSRPIRWMVSLLGEKEVKIQIENVISGSMSRGHRFAKEFDVKITNADTYLDELYASNVIVDTAKRKEKVIEEAKKVAASVNAEVYLDDTLLEEVTYINEWPVGVLGEFAKDYLKVPKEVIITVMASHQRYFPVFEKGTDKLLNCFITMANFVGDDFTNIKRGNERVIKARLDDAIFFYNDDTKNKLETKFDKLEGVTFQKGLGSLAQKITRIETLAKDISAQFGLDEVQTQKVLRTAKLAKVDIVTNLVREFTELEGVIGSQYATLDGEDKDVCVGIQEHYYPLGAESASASSYTGQVVGIADKIDTICGVFAIGKIPTGSADPLGLRRASLGIMTTIMNKNLPLNLSEIIEKAVSIQPIKVENPTELIEKIRAFVLLRLKNYLSEKYRYDVIDAVLESSDPFVDLNDTIKRIALVQELVQKSDFAKLHESANRIIRIIKNETAKGEINPALFVEAAETGLFEAVKGLSAETSDYAELIKQLEAANPKIEKFFEDVLVMDKDENIKNNRVVLLSHIQKLFAKICDFSKITG